MSNEFEPLNSNLLGEDMSNFSFKNIFKRKKKKSDVVNKPTPAIKPMGQPKKDEPSLGLGTFKPIDRILKAVDDLKAQFNYNGDVSNQSLNNSYSYLGIISDVNNSVNEGYKSIVSDFVAKYKPLIPPTSSGSASTVVEKTNLINQLKYDLNKFASSALSLTDFDSLKTMKVVPKWDIELYNIKDNSIRKSLKQGAESVIKIVKDSKGDVIVYFLEKGGNKDGLQDKYVPAWLHNFKGEIKGDSVENVLNTYFTVSK